VQVHYAHEWLAEAPHERLRHRGEYARARTAARIAAPRRLAAAHGPFPADPFGQGMRAAVELAALDRSLPVIHDRPQRARRRQAPFGR
jgi:hypothetical protein